jgi:hypothetical protein
MYYLLVYYRDELAFVYEIVRNKNFRVEVALYDRGSSGRKRNTDG